MLKITSFFKAIFCGTLFCILIFNFAVANESKSFMSKLNRCITCHTISGNSIMPIWPKIAEQHFEYMMKQLVEFKKGKSGDRFDPNMFAMLQGINDEELYGLAEYFSKQVLEKSKGIVDENLFNYGKKLYLYGDSSIKLSGCVGCHGIDASGNKLAKIPALRWQHKDYIILQMKKFKSNDRSNDLNGVMRDISIVISDDQVAALAEYIAFIE